VTLYGPLLDRGMTFREISSHTRAEIVAMKTILERYDILQNCGWLQEKAKKEAIGGKEAIALNRYLEEVEKLGQKEEPEP